MHVPGKSTTPNRVVLTPASFLQLTTLCLEALPNEICGALSGQFAPVSSVQADAGFELHVSGVISIANAAADPSKQFVFDPSEWVRALYDIQKNRQSLVGFFHSHPHSTPVPSPSDLKGMVYSAEGISYWILSPQPGGSSVNLQPYWYQDGGFTPLMLA
ncbi:Mov34/MPN/PAD-1 family protein [Paenibacillus sp. R14(2021)]|uniref:Mov34/MPN/PAD-1 family protein n=1 Tax=Paenibacillus sp. R14(2021) TaxID=2859228 RepID=UPI001C6130FD|nr:M67 family metallopeptidase [Paenibacillus sp. R14(2021)]